MSNKTLTELQQYLRTSETLTDREKTELLNIIGSPKPWYIIVLQIIKYLGTVAGYFLAGLGLASCSSFTI